MIVDHTLQQPVTGRYFRLRVDKSTTNQWTAIRIHEWEMYYIEVQTDKTALQAAYDEYQGLVEDKYTPATWEAFKAALDKAAEVIADEEATQEAVDTAKAALESAVAALVEIVILSLFPFIRRKTAGSLPAVFLFWETEKSV